MVIQLSWGANAPSCVVIGTHADHIGVTEVGRRLTTEFRARFGCRRQAHVQFGQRRFRPRQIGFASRKMLLGYEQSRFGRVQTWLRRVQKKFRCVQTVFRLRQNGLFSEPPGLGYRQRRTLSGRMHRGLVAEAFLSERFSRSTEFCSA